MPKINYPIHICFVCSGNTCRSPMTEYIFKYLIHKRNVQDKFIVTSAGTYAISTKFISKGAQQQLELHNIPFNKKHLSQLFTEQIYENNDFIFAMDDMNIYSIKNIIDNPIKVKKLLQYANKQYLTANHIYNCNIIDPYGSEMYDITFNDIYHGCETILNHFLKKYRLDNIY